MMIGDQGANQINISIAGTAVTVIKERYLIIIIITPTIILKLKDE